MHAAHTPRYGAPSIIELVESPRPTVGAKELLIQVYASPVTAGDRRLRSADFPGISALPGRLAMGITGPRHPTQGSMFAGRVVEIGADVTRYAVGDDVFGEVGYGAYAELLSMHEDGSLAPMPQGATHADASALPYGAGTALHFLRDLAKVQPGERVLILGASGGVGRYAIELAKHLGAEVTGVASARHADLMRSLGADHVVDYAASNPAHLESTYDVIFDLADAMTFGQARALLSPTGRYMTVYISVGVLCQMAVTALRGGPRALFTISMMDADSLRDLAELMAEGVIHAHVVETYPLDRIAQAHQAAEAGLEAGEIVVQMNTLAS